MLVWRLCEVLTTHSVLINNSLSAGNGVCMVFVRTHRLCIWPLVLTILTFWAEQPVVSLCHLSSLSLRGKEVENHVSSTCALSKLIIYFVIKCTVYTFFFVVLYLRYPPSLWEIVWPHQRDLSLARSQCHCHMTRGMPQPQHSLTHSRPLKMIIKTCMKISYLHKTS